MFTGLIETTGTVTVFKPEAAGRRLVVESTISPELTPGDSIAVNGVCLTAVARGQSAFEADVSPQTLRVTTLGGLRVGQTVNLERPLAASDRLGGHFVLGHVDGVGSIRRLQPDGDCFWIEVGVPRELAPYLIPKGSIAVDGISLTVAELLDDGVRVQIVPFTWSHTALSSARVGDRVNIETDVIGKYVARLLGHRAGIAGTEEAGTLDPATK